MHTDRPAPPLSSAQHAAPARRTSAGWLEISRIYALIALGLFAVAVYFIYSTSLARSPEPDRLPNRQDIDQHVRQQQATLREEQARGLTFARHTRRLTAALPDYALEQMSAQRALTDLTQWRLSYPWPTELAALRAGQWLSADGPSAAADDSPSADEPAAAGDSLFAMERDNRLALMPADDGSVRIQLRAPKSNAVNYALQQLPSAPEYTLAQQWLPNASVLEILLFPSADMVRMRLQPVTRLYQQKLQALADRAEKILPGIESDWNDALAQLTSRREFNEKQKRLKSVQRQLAGLQIVHRRLSQEFAGHISGLESRRWQGEMHDLGQRAERLTDSLQQVLQAAFKLSDERDDAAEAPGASSASPPSAPVKRRR